MKKFFLAAIAALSLTIVSCSGNSNEAKAKEYLEQMEAALDAGDMEKYEAISEELTKWEATLSESEQGELLRALVSDPIYTRITSKAIEVSMKQAADEIGEAEEEAESAIEEAVEAEDIDDAISSAYDEAASEMNAAIEETAGAYGEAAKAAASAASSAAAAAVNDAQKQAAKAVLDAQKQAAKAVQNAQKQAADALKQYGF